MSEALLGPRPRDRTLPGKQQQPRPGLICASVRVATRTKLTSASAINPERTSSTHTCNRNLQTNFAADFRKAGRNSMQQARAHAPRVSLSLRVSVRWNRPKSSESGGAHGRPPGKMKSGTWHLRRERGAEPTTKPPSPAGPNTKTKTMKTTSTSVLLALALLPLAADAHGYMTKPPSRSDLAHAPRLLPGPRTDVGG